MQGMALGFPTEDSSAHSINAFQSVINRAIHVSTRLFQKVDENLDGCPDTLIY